MTYRSKIFRSQIGRARRIRLCAAPRPIAEVFPLADRPTVAERPQAARRASPKLPEDQPGFSAFRFYEAAVRDLRQPAMNRPSPA